MARLAYLIGAVLAAAGCEPVVPAPDAASDRAAPDTILRATPAPLVGRAVATFEFESTELGSRFECALDQVAFAPCASPFASAALADGGHLFRVRAVDQDGNFDLTPAAASWTVDTTAPATSVVAAPAALTNQDSAVVEFACSETGCTYQCSLDTLPIAPCHSPLVVQQLDQGAHTIAIRAVDAAGNSDPQPQLVRWQVDLTPPTISSLRLNSGAPATYGRQIVVEIAAVEAVDLQLGVAGGVAEDWRPFASTQRWALPAVDTGAVVVAQVRDAAGNVSAPSVATIQLDRSDAPRPFIAVGLSEQVELGASAGQRRAIDRVVVGSRGGVAAQQLSDRVVAWGGHLLGGLPELPGYLVALPDQVGVATALAELAAWPELAWVEGDQVGRAADLGGGPLDPGYRDDTQWYLRRIGADRAWALLDRVGIAFGVPTTRVALIDTGIDLLHPELAGNVALGEYGALPANLVDAEPIDGRDPAGWPQDQDGHGTHGAGIIAAAADAVPDAATAAIGIAPAVTLVPIKAAGNGDFFSFRVAAALQRAMRVGVDVVNLGFDLPDSVLLRAALLAAHAGRGGHAPLLVHSAGNWDADDCELPSGSAASADLADALFEVAATDRDDRRSSFSRYASTVDLAAPGGDVTACGEAPDADDIWSSVPGAGHGFRAGTSSAAAMVSGAAALLFALDHALGGARELTAAEVAEMLQRGATLVGDASFAPGHLGSRRLDVDRALRLASCSVIAPFQDAGDGACLPPGRCAPGFHLGGPSLCLPLGRCADGFSLAGDRCIAAGLDAGNPDRGSEDAGALDARAPALPEDGGVVVDDAGSAHQVLVLQPGPDQSKDIWTSSAYSFCPDGASFPGGGMESEYIELGGWDDLYVGLIQFDLSRLPLRATSARVELYCPLPKGDGTTAVEVRRISEFWDWRVQGLGRDRLRVWWADRPASEALPDGLLPAPEIGVWYAIDVTGLFNDWQRGALPNYGLLLRPIRNDNRWNEFASSRYLIDPALRPRLVVVAVAR